MTPFEWMLICHKEALFCSFLSNLVDLLTSCNITPKLLQQEFGAGEPDTKWLTNKGLLDPELRPIFLEVAGLWFKETGHTGEEFRPSCFSASRAPFQGFFRHLILEGETEMRR